MSSSGSKSPAFQFYPSDFTGSGKVGVMTIDEVGAYTLLLCMEWDQGGFAYDEAELARFCRVSRAKFRALWPRVSRCFVQRDGRWFNPRLDAERAKQQAFREKQQAKANARWAMPRESHGNAAAMPEGMPDACSLSPTPSLTPKKKKNPTVADAPVGEPGAASAPRDQPPFRLAPYLDVHREIRGESVPPAAKWAKSFKALERKFGAGEVLTRWRRCLVAKGEFATPQWLGANWGDYAEDAPGRSGEKSPLQELEELGAQDSWWTEGLEAARRKRAA